MKSWCPIRSRAQRIVTALRKYANGDPVDIKGVAFEIMVLRQEIAAMPYESLRKREDLRFYIKNAINATKHRESIRELQITFSIVNMAIEHEKKEHRGIFH